MNEFYLIIVAASVGALSGFIANIALEAYRHKNSVSKTVQDKLHLDRAEVIKKLYAKLVLLERQIYFDFINTEKKKVDDKTLNNLCSSFETIYEENSIFFNTITKDRIKKLIIALRKAITFNDRIPLNNHIKNIPFSPNFLIDEINEEMVLLEIEFSKLLGVK